jgi:hypothetical protein
METQNNQTESNLKQIIYDLETSLLQSEVRLSEQHLIELLADDFMEFGSSGRVFSKSDIVERLPNDPETEKVQYSVENFEVRELAENIVLATYKATKIHEDESEIISLRSSIWRETNGKWQMFFHQGTISQ